MSAEVRLTREGRCIMSENLATWLRQQRETRGWTKREMGRQLIQAGRATGRSRRALAVPVGPYLHVQLVGGAAGENVLIYSAVAPRLPLGVDDIDLVGITPRQRQRVQRPVLVDVEHPALLAAAVHGRSLGTGSAA